MDLENRAGLEMDLQAREPAVQETAGPNASWPPLLLWDQLESWQQEDRCYLESGYRKASPSLSGCLQSLTYLHNETVNIYSHAIGAVAFIILPVCIFTVPTPPRHQVATSTDIFVGTIYFLSIIASFLLSAISHTLKSHSQPTLLLSTHLHFQSLIILLWGVNIPLIYYGFICDARLQVIYWTIVSVLALGCSVSTFLAPAPQTQVVRTIIFGSLALSMFVAVTHGLMVYGLDVQIRRLALHWVVYAIMCVSVGAAVHVLRFPERLFPRRFDIFGASHQILHISLLAGAVVYTMGLLAEFDFLHGGSTTCGGSG